MESDIALLSATLRPMDVLEIRKLAGVDPEVAIRMSLQNAKIACCLRDRAGVPVSIMGIGWLPNPRTGIAWFLSSDKVEKIGLLFLQETRASIDAWMQGHDVISNYVYSRNEKTIKWLKWLGFEILSETTTPHSDGELFFEMARFQNSTVRDLYRDRDWAKFAHASQFSYAG